MPDWAEVCSVGTSKNQSDRVTQTAFQTKTHNKITTRRPLWTNMDADARRLPAHSGANVITHNSEKSILVHYSKGVFLSGTVTD